MKDYIDMAIDQVASAKQTAKNSMETAADEVAQQAFQIFEAQLAVAGSPYDVKLFKKGNTYTIVPQDQEKAFEIHIGGPFSSDGESTTKNEPDQLIIRAVDEIKRFLANYQSKTGMNFQVNYTIGNPTR